MAGEAGETAGLVWGGVLDHSNQAEKADIEGDSVGGSGVAISADDAAAGGGEIDILAVGDGLGAIDAEGEPGEEAGFLEEIELEG